MATKKKLLDHARLKRLADEIASYPQGPDGELIRLYQANEGLRLAEVPKGSGVHRVTMAGITAISNEGPFSALINWGNKARRSVRMAG